jgi:tetratricopeptide (TPR) repeat protein
MPDHTDPHLAAQQQLDEALAVLQRLQTQGDPALEEHRHAAWLRKVQALHQLGQHQASVEAADAFIAQVADDAGGPRARWVAEALTRKGLALREIGDVEAELAAYAEVQSRYDDATTAEARLWLAHAGFEHNQRRAGLGGTFSQVDVVRNCEALAERFGADALLETRVVAARARAFRAFVLDGLGYHQDALAIYQTLQGDFSQAPEPELRLQAAQAGSAWRSRWRKKDHDGAADPQAAIAAWAGLLAQYGHERGAEMRALLAEPPSGAPMRWTTRANMHWRCKPAMACWRRMATRLRSTWWCTAAARCC